VKNEEKLGRMGKKHLNLDGVMYVLREKVG